MSRIFDLDTIKAVYDRFPARVKAAREVVGRPLTLSEKILYAHLWDGEAKTAFGRGKDYVEFAPTGWPCRTPPPRWPCSSS